MTRCLSQIKSYVGCNTKFEVKAHDCSRAGPPTCDGDYPVYIRANSTLPRGAMLKPISSPRGPGYSERVVEWVPARGDEGAAFTACFTAGLACVDEAKCRTRAQALRLAWMGRVHRRDVAAGCGVSGGVEAYWNTAAGGLVVGGAPSASGEARSQRPQELLCMDAEVSQRCWTMHVQKCQYCLGGGDTLAVMMKVQCMLYLSSHAAAREPERSAVTLCDPR